MTLLVIIAVGQKEDLQVVEEDLPEGGGGGGPPHRGDGNGNGNGDGEDDGEERR